MWQANTDTESPLQWPAAHQRYLNHLMTLVCAHLTAAWHCGGWRCGGDVPADELGSYANTLCSCTDGAEITVLVWAETA